MTVVLHEAVKVADHFFTSPDGVEKFLGKTMAWRDAYAQVAGMGWEQAAAHIKRCVHESRALRKAAMDAWFAWCNAGRPARHLLNSDNEAVQAYLTYVAEHFGTAVQMGQLTLTQHHNQWCPTCRHPG